MGNATREMITRQIRDALNIVDVVGSYVNLRRAGAVYKGLCPFHQEKTPSFNVNPDRQIFKCFGCGVGGDLFKFIELKENVDFLEARRILAERAGISLEIRDNAAAVGHASYTKSDLARANQWAMKVYRRQYERPEGNFSRQYVETRGISKAMADAFVLGFAPDSYDFIVRQAATAKIDPKLLLAAGLLKEGQRGLYDTFRNRLMFPISDATGRIVGFGGRTLADDPAKYLNTPATALFDKSSNLFALDKARESIAQTGRVIVVEGYTDCMMAHQFGFTETVATLGTAMTETHANTLRRYTERVILLFDSDAAGQKAADRAISVTLTSGLDVLLTRVPEGKDPCDYLLSAGKEGFELVLKASISAVEFKWRQLLRDYGDSGTGTGRRRAIETLLQQLSVWLGRGAIDSIAAGLLVTQVSSLLSLPAEDVHRQLKNMVQQVGSRAVSGSSRMTHASEGSAGITHRPVNLWTGSAQQALRQILEVLLNAPHLWASVKQWFNPSDFQDESLEQIACELIEACATESQWRLDDFIGRFDSPAIGQLIVDLQMRGEKFGYYEQTLDAAVECLRGCRETRETAELADQIRLDRQKSDPGVEQPVNPESEDERLWALVEKARANSHFASTRARKKYLRN